MTFLTPAFLLGDYHYFPAVQFIINNTEKIYNSLTHL